MVKVKYTGDIFPTRVKAKGEQYFIKESGDVIDVSEDVLEHLLQNKNFERVEGKPATKKEKKKEVVSEVKEVIEEVADKEFSFNE